MNIILKIARAELRSLFFSPIAWLIILVYYVVCGYQFASPLVDVARIQEANLENDPSWSGRNPLSFEIFSGSISQVLGYFYLFIPLLTMGVISREVNTGSIKLLYSSPVRVRAIVLGKYLGLVAFSMLLLLIVGLLFATGYFTIVQAEYKWYLSILLGFFLLSSCYIAIGLFISGLTHYPVVAAILTFAVFFLLQAMRQLWQEYDFFRDLTYFLAMTNKTQPLIAGLIRTSDVLYFLIIVVMFLAFAIIKLKSTQESKSWRVSFLRYTVVSVVVLLVGYCSSRPGYIGYLDVTRSKLNSIHPATQAVVKEMDGSPLTVTLYTNLLGRAPKVGMPAYRNNYIWDFWEKYIQYYPNIRFRYEYFYDVNEQNKEILTNFTGKTIEEVAALLAEFMQVDIRRFKKPEAIRKIVDLSAEDNGLIMELEYKGRKEFLRTYSDLVVYPNQYHVSGTLRRLVRPESPKIYFTTGHYERSPYRYGEREYGYATNQKLSRSAMINMGVNIDTVSLLHRAIPADIAALVVADPKSAFDPIEQQRVVDFMKGGGNVIFYGEPGKQQMLNPMLEAIGVTLDNGIIVMPGQQLYAPDRLIGVVNPTGARMADEPWLYWSLRGGLPPGLEYYGGTNISFGNKDGFKVEPIYGVTPTKEAWIEKGLYVADSAAPVFSEAEGDIKKSYFVGGVQLTRTINNKQQRIMVSGDADFMSPRRGAGGGIANGMFSWTLYNDYPVYVNYPARTDLNVKIGFDTARAIYVAYVYVIPAFVLLGAVLLLVRRKRK